MSLSHSGHANRVRSACCTHTSTRPSLTDSSTRSTPHGATTPSRWRYNSVSRMARSCPRPASQDHTGPTENPEAPNYARTVHAFLGTVFGDGPEHPPQERMHGPRIVGRFGVFRGSGVVLTCRSGAGSGHARHRVVPPSAGSGSSVGGGSGGAVGKGWARGRVGAAC